MTLQRLSIIIQNLHLLMIPTRSIVFDDYIFKLFRRYFVTCNLLEDAERAHSAWISLHRAGMIKVLEHPMISLDYLSTLFQHMHTDLISSRDHSWMKKTKAMYDHALGCAPNYHHQAAYACLRAILMPPHTLQFTHEAVPLPRHACLWLH
jgi:hypothetical protein